MKIDGVLIDRFLIFSNGERLEAYIVRVAGIGSVSIVNASTGHIKSDRLVILSSG